MDHTYIHQVADQLNKARRNKPHSTEFVLPRSLAHLFS